MSAKLDRSQPIKFYYGNALEDLNAFLPADDFVPFHTAAQNHLQYESLDLSHLHRILDMADDHITKMSESRRELAFLLSDLKRIIG